MNSQGQTAAAGDTPLVSIVTPTFNQSQFLRDTVESVLAQDYPRVEYLVLDDGSTDATPQILAEYTGRIEWESQPNMGQTPTINKGWQRLRGEIVTWLNSDDTLLPGALTKAVDYFKRNPEVGVVFGDTLFTGEDGTPIERSPARGAFDYERFVVECENPIAQPSAFIRRRVVEDTGLLDPHYYYFMDWDFWLRAGARHRIEYAPELFSTYRLHAESKTVAQAARAAPELEWMYKKYFALEGVPAGVRRREARAMANMYFTSGGYYLTGGNPRGARRAALKAVRAYPAALARPAMAHKFLYCLFGGRRAYRGGSAIYRRARTALGGS
ncbi:MAG: glycosyltransferase [Acidobacteria bacterium]|nr:glycosyltransferase [Acidobacteriota bacterium]